MYAICNGDGVKRLWLQKLERALPMIWDADGKGEVSPRQMELPPKGSPREAGVQVTARYRPEAANARKFRTRERAEQVIRENPVLRFCHVEEV